MTEPFWEQDRLIADHDDYYSCLPERYQRQTTAEAFHAALDRAYDQRDPSDRNMTEMLTGHDPSPLAMGAARDPAFLLVACLRILGIRDDAEQQAFAREFFDNVWPLRHWNGRGV